MVEDLFNGWSVKAAEAAWIHHMFPETPIALYTKSKLKAERVSLREAMTAISMEWLINHAKSQAWYIVACEIIGGDNHPPMPRPKLDHYTVQSRILPGNNGDLALKKRW